MSDVIFNLTATHISKDEHGNIYTWLFGVTKDAKTVAVKCHDFRPRMFIRIPRSWGKNRNIVSRFVDRLTKDDAVLPRGRSSKAIIRNAGKVTHRIVRRSYALGYNHDPKTGGIAMHLLLELRCSRMHTFYKLRSIFAPLDSGARNSRRGHERLLQEIGYTGPVVGDELTAHGGQIPMELQFKEHVGVTSCDWIRATGTMRTKDKCESTCAIEMESCVAAMSRHEADCDTIGPELVMAFDIEAYSDSGRFPQASNPLDPVINIGMSFQRAGATGVDSDVVLCLGACGESDDTPTISCESESALLSKFSDIIAERDVGIIVGYNNWNFDWVYLCSRAALINFFDGTTIDACEATWAGACATSRRYKRFETEYKNANENNVKHGPSKRGVFTGKVTSCRCAECVVADVGTMLDTYARGDRMPSLPLLTTLLASMSDRQELGNAFRYFGGQGPTTFFALGRLRGKQTKLTCKRLNSAAFGQNTLHQVHMVGRVNVDLYLTLKTSTHKLVSYKLGAVVDHFLTDVQKTDLGGADPYQTLFANWRHIRGTVPGSTEYAEGLRLRRVNAEYCAQDCRVLLLLMDHLCTLPGLVEMARICHTSLNDLVNRGQQIRVFSCMVHEANKSRVLINTKIVKAPDSYVGATVLIPIAGYERRPVGTLDFASLYPSIIESNNICPSTYVFPGINNKRLRYLRQKKVPLLCVDVGGHQMYYVKKRTHRGLLPKMVRGLLAERRKVKLEMATATGFRKILLNCRQKAIKITANSMYGALGAKRGLIVFWMAAASVTQIGRLMITDTKQACESALPATGGPTPGAPEPVEGASYATVLEWARTIGVSATVIYGDTDSVMPRLDNLPQTRAGMAIAWRILVALAEYITRDVFAAWPEIVLEAEDMAWGYAIWETKKRYVKRLLDVKRWCCTITSKGVESKRRDTPQLLRTIYNRVLSLMFPANDEPPLTADVITSVVIPYLRDAFGEIIRDAVDIGDYVVYKSLKSDYKSKAIAQLVVAEKRRKRILSGEETGIPPKVGERIPYVITTGTGKVSMRAEDPAYIERRWAAGYKTPTIDRLYYVNNLLQTSLQKLVSHVCAPQATQVIEHAKRVIACQLAATRICNRRITEYGPMDQTSAVRRDAPSEPVITALAPCKKKQRTMLSYV